MAETEAFDIRKWWGGFINPVTWGKAVTFLIIGSIIVFILVCVKNFIFPKSNKQTISSDVVVKPFGKIETGGVKIDNNQILVEEKPWEVGVGLGGFRYDGKDGYGGLVWGKRKF